MEPEELLKIKKLIDSLNLNLTKIDSEDIAYVFLKQAIESLERKIDMGKNPYKMSSNACQSFKISIDFIL